MVFLMTFTELPLTKSLGWLYSWPMFRTCNDTYPST